MKICKNLIRMIASTTVLATLSAGPLAAEPFGVGFTGPAFLTPGANTFDNFSGMVEFADNLAGSLSDFLPEDASETPANENAALGSQCLTDPACSACAGDADARANRAFEVLINNERLLARTLRKAKMLENVAEGAASQHAAAKAAYTIQLASEIEPAKREFFKNLGKAQNAALDVLHVKLKQIGTCEQEHLGSATFLALAEHSYQIAKLRFALSLKGEGQ